VNIQEYKSKIAQVGFGEYPYSIGDNPLALGDFLNFSELDLDLKIYLAKLIICRCFPPTGGIVWPQNPDWFIHGFLASNERDLLKPWFTGAIREAIEMIMSEKSFTKGVIGTTFLFGVIEFYVKHKLGFRPNEFDFFDEAKRGYFKTLYGNEKRAPYELGLKKAFDFLQERKEPISLSLNEIDAHNIQRLKEFGVEERRYTKAKVSERVSLSRNTMVHGESHSFYAEGEYLVMLYILFLYNDHFGTSETKNGVS